MLRPALALILLLAACAQTKVESTWKNPALPDRKIQQFAVFGVTGSPSGRIQFEENLTKGLKDRGLDALPGYDFVLYDERPSKEEVIARLKAKNVEGVLVSKIARRTTKTESTPVYVGGGYGTYYSAGFYDYWYAPMAVASYTTETNEFIVETVLYALTDDQPMWATRTNTKRTDAAVFANDIAGSVATGLKTAGIVPQ